VSARPDGLAGLRILVVEDEMLVAMMVEDMLRGMGCDVVGPAGSVEDALVEIRGQHLDGALLDINLQGRDSSPLAEALRDREVPFLVVTGYGRTEIGNAALDTAPRLKKPFGLAELMDRMTEVILGTPAHR
jgi:DNA-binding response OmpR family regulator